MEVRWNMMTAHYQCISNCQPNKALPKKALVLERIFNFERNQLDCFQKNVINSHANIYEEILHAVKLAGQKKSAPLAGIQM
jgi:hypothetical protein